MEKRRDPDPAAKAGTNTVNTLWTGQLLSALLPEKGLY
jgi:hypothetical protein